MKVTIQNGAEHGLTRLEVEAIVPLFPSAWSKSVQQIVLYQSLTGSLATTYHPKQRLLGLHWPRPKELASKENGIRELLLAISVAVELGELPSKLANAVRLRHLEAVEELRSRCSALVAQNAT